jgi:CRISPR-associated protein Cmr1
MNTLRYLFRAQNPIWTGSVEEIKLGKKNDKINNIRLEHTNLLGSIRWWFEVLVRGLEGYACNPGVDKSRCPTKKKKPGDPGHHCVVCELFGCTDWARKFRFQVLDNDANPIIHLHKNNNPPKAPIDKNDSFILQFCPLRPIRDEEWVLLDATLRLISKYGALGGKTILKPSDEPNRKDAVHHRDYGIIHLEDGQTKKCKFFTQKSLNDYVQQDGRWRTANDKEFAWASLQNFWFVDGIHLTRNDSASSSFNMILGRNVSKACQDCGSIHDPSSKCPQTHKHPHRYSEQLVSNSAINKWLAGSHFEGESKKVFSFKYPVESRRTFGFVNPKMVEFEEIKKRLRCAWAGDLEEKKFETGENILKSLFSEGKPK